MKFLFDKWEVDCKTQTLKNPTGEIQNLRKQTLDTLVYLLQHNKEVCTYEAMLEQLWPGRFVKKESIINEMYVIRKALGVDRGLISTHRLKGFSINCESITKASNDKVANQDLQISFPTWHEFLKIVLEKSRKSTSFTFRFAARKLQNLYLKLVTTSL